MLLAATFALRIIHSSDTHGWLYGDPHEPKRDAGFAGVLSYIRHSKERYPTFAFDSGDFIQGCGLSDAEDNVGDFVYYMWHRALAPGTDYYNAVTIGNHDMQVASTAPNLYNNFFYDAGMKDVFTSTNTFVAGEMAQPNSKFRRSENGGVSTFVTGYMYSLAAKNPFYIRDFWAMQEGDEQLEYRIRNERPDFFTVLFHTGYNSRADQFYEHYQYIRQFTDAPIVILGGHEHQTAYDYKIDISKIQGRLKQYGLTVNTNWQDIFVTEGNKTYDRNLIIAETLNYYKNISVIDIEFEASLTPSGSKIVKSVTFNEQVTNLAEFAAEFNVSADNWLDYFETDLNDTIFAKVNELHLLDVVGEAPMDYISWCSEYDKDETCIWNLWFYHIVPYVLYKSVSPAYNESRAVTFAGSSFFVNDIPKGDIFENDLYVTLSYKDEWFWVYRDFPVKDLKKVFSGLGNYYDYPHIKHLDDSEVVDLIITDYDGAKFEKELERRGMKYPHEPFGAMCPFDVYSTWVKTFWQKSE